MNVFHSCNITHFCYRVYILLLVQLTFFDILFIDPFMSLTQLLFYFNVFLFCTYFLITHGITLKPVIMNALFPCTGLSTLYKNNNTVVKMRTCVSVLASHTHDDVTPGRRYLSPFEADPLTAEHHSNI